MASHYGFTNEELDFIINYDIKYRMGDELENYVNQTVKKWEGEDGRMVHCLGRWKVTKETPRSMA